MKLLVGLAALPRTLSLDDPRLPWIELTHEPLRLNTHPVPAQLLAETPPDHDSRVTAITRWLQSQAAPWDTTTRRAIADYIASLTEFVTRHRAQLEHRLTRYDDLYAPQDLIWSALRPLPRTWFVEADAPPRFVDLGRWDGEQMRSWPEPEEEFWLDQNLPSSPFRR